MIARFGLVRKREDVTDAAFDHHWRDVHGPLAAKMKGLRRYDQHRVVDSQQFGIDAARGPWNLDGMSELHFDDHAAMRAAVTDAAYAPTVVDEGNVFADVHVVACEKHVVVPVAPGQGPYVKRMTLLRRPEGMSVAEFRHEWLTVHAGLVRQWPDVLGYVQNIVIDRYQADRDRSAPYSAVPVDGIVEFRFRDRETAAKLYASEIVARTQEHAAKFLAEITPFFVETRRIV
ncbi:EthD domain-containing protein [Mesobacterium pallidum]|uniref:EthD domain-containing protein n=1 Tax=Mesobacterium pallidum TaxID=2872037 RepID=UPI001EE31A48|nr:EthD domain-containing protein [Mesobacterium pallidum]